jgi:hypothetical protein
MNVSSFRSNGNKCRIRQEVQAVHEVCFLSSIPTNYRYAPHNDVSVDDGPHIRRWSNKIIVL